MQLSYLIRDQPNKPIQTSELQDEGLRFLNGMYNKIGSYLSTCRDDAWIHGK